MDSASSTATREIAQDFSPVLKIFKDGSIERLMGTDVVPPGLDPATKVTSKDVLHSPELNVSARLYLPENASPNRKLPLLIYIHGGAFCIGSPFCALYHNYLNSIVSEANVVALSVGYRLAPEHRIPAAYEDSWAALQWVASHAGGDGPEEWLNSHADLTRVFLAGDSAGGNICHHMCMRNGKERLQGIDLIGVVLIHPYFWGKEPVGNEPKEPERRAYVDAIWLFVSPSSSVGFDDPLINPDFEPGLDGLGCEKVLVVVAEKDILRDRGWRYHERLKESGWSGNLEFMEIRGEEHVFHLHNSNCVNSVAMLQKVASFVREA